MMSTLTLLRAHLPWSIGKKAKLKTWHRDGLWQVTLSNESIYKSKVWATLLLSAHSVHKKNSLLATLQATYELSFGEIARCTVLCSVLPCSVFVHRVSNRSSKFFTMVRIFLLMIWLNVGWPNEFKREITNSYINNKKRTYWLSVISLEDQETKIWHITRLKFRYQDDGYGST